MHTRLRAISVLFLIALSASGARAATAPDLSGIRAHIDQVVVLLEAPGLTRRQRRQAILEQVGPAFDWRGMARAALGPRWRDRTPAERAEFTSLYRSLVEDSYLTLVR